ncbi:GNAT family N-acetyltransferase [Thalassomonas sp. RHCl1]|uniref:GNAT family N-acetyltransferase n=1 Tax=Thalassomonas sp. RHCl1 TaxID=2995320 RepID=UPI00248BECF5|nr:GNAT family N-acetyltransferase [Thalassomonas sp. RHCl1]
MLTIRQGSFEEAIAIKANIPEMLEVEPVSQLLERIGSSPYLLLIAEVDGELAGFKLGYETSKAQACFYSWQGGVLPAYRSQGIAKKLLRAQEIQVAELGYKKITVKSMNRFPHMMKMLLSNGYHISGYQEKTGPDDAKISFYKRLNNR